MQKNHIKQINVNTRDKYNIFAGQTILDYLCGYLENKQRIVVSDSNVYGVHRNALEKIAKDRNRIFYFEAGEKSKNYKILHSIYDFLIENSADRYTYVIAVGGGVVGDVAAFAASTYMRGIPIVHIPTSLLAMVDSSIGGKTAINYGGFKNIIGSFYQPSLVLCDIDFLDTLPEREFNSALAEVIKYGIIADKEFFDFLEVNREGIKNRNKEVLLEMVVKSIENKVKIVEADEKEGGIRAALNFGHTLAHAIESITNYSIYFHGEAVAIGEMLASKISLKKGMLGIEDFERIESLLRFFNLPVNIDKDTDTKDLYNLMKKDKKSKNGVLRFVLTKKIGKFIITGDLDKSEIMDAIDELKG